MRLFLKLKEGFTYDDGRSFVFSLDDEELEFKKDGNPIPDLPSAELSKSIEIPESLVLQVKETDLNPLGAGAETDWWRTVEIEGENKIRLKPEAIEDILIVTQYAVTKEE